MSFPLSLRATAVTFLFLAAPLAADLQQPGKVYKVGILATESPGIQSFRQALSDQLIE